jgi:hypothetical protein
MKEILINTGLSRPPMIGKDERNPDQHSAFTASRTAKLTVKLNGNKSHHRENDHDS